MLCACACTRARPKHRNSNLSNQPRRLDIYRISHTLDLTQMTLDLHTLDLTSQISHPRSHTPDLAPQISHHRSHPTAKTRLPQVSATSLLRPMGSMGSMGSMAARTCCRCTFCPLHLKFQSCSKRCCPSSKFCLACPGSRSEDRQREGRQGLPISRSTTKTSGASDRWLSKCTKAGVVSLVSTLTHLRSMAALMSTSTVVLAHAYL